MKPRIFLASCRRIAAVALICQVMSAGVAFGQSLALSRKSYATHLVKRGPSPDAERDGVPTGRRLTEPRTDAEKITYLSGQYTLSGYLMKPVGPGLHPAVVYAHGGYRLHDSDMENAKLFLKSGFVVLLPTWRGERGNPGVFEMWYGEVDDAVAAVMYVKSLPIVDRDRTFIVGHSVGGTIAMLTAEMTSEVRAAAASGGSPTMDGWNRFSWVPVDLRDPKEFRLRSPGAFPSDVKVPLALFYGVSGGDEYYISSANVMTARAAGRVTVTVIPGATHGTAMRIAIPQMIKLFLQPR